jgi:CHAT domain-containing protein
VVEAYIAFLARNPNFAPGGAGEDTLGLADILRGQAVQRALAASSARAATNDPNLAELARKEQDYRKQIGSSLRKLNGLLAQPSPQRDPNGVKLIQTAIEKLRTAKAAVRREIDRRFPKYGDLVDPAPVKVGQLQRLLHADEVVLSFYFGEYESFVWAVPKQGAVKFLRLPVTLGEMDENVAKLREALEPDVDQVANIPAFDVALAYQLYDQLLRPIETIWRPSKHIIVMTNGALAALPLGILPTAPGVIAETVDPLFANYREVAWLARTHAVTVVPSAAALRSLWQLPPNRNQRTPFVGFGGAYFGADQVPTPENNVAAAPQPAIVNSSEAGPTQITADNSDLKFRAAGNMTGMDNLELAGLPPLPDTAEELKSIAAALNVDPATTLHLGKDANEQTVKNLKLWQYRTVAFATHGLLPGDLNGLTQPALALTLPALAGVDGDGLLTMDEILTLKLDADWVVLSACNSAAGSTLGAEAASGLARAFFYAGTRAVLATNWPVHSASARELVTDVFRRLSADTKLSRDEALRRAMVSMIDNGGFVDSSGEMLYTYAHPMFWAAYSLIGDYR